MKNIFKLMIMFLSCWGLFACNSNSNNHGNPNMTNNTAANKVSSSYSTTEPYVYVVDTAAEAIYMYQVDTNGTLRPLSTEVIATGPNPVAITIDPTSRFVYVANMGYGTDKGSVSYYSIDPNSGILTAKGNIEADSPVAVVVDKNAQHAYIANNVSNSISAYNVDSTGMLIPIPGTTPVSTLYDVQTLAISSTNGSLYAGHYNQGTKPSNEPNVDIFSINTDGSLTNTNQPIAAGFNNYLLTMSPLANKLYTGSEQGNTSDTRSNIMSYQLDKDDETPTFKSSVGDLADLNAMVTSADGRYLFTADASGLKINTYPINRDSASLNQLSSSNISTNAYMPSDMVLGQKGQLFVTFSWNNDTNKPEQRFGIYNINTNDGQLINSSISLIPNMQSGSHNANMIAVAIPAVSNPDGGPKLISPPQNGRRRLLTMESTTIIQYMYESDTAESKLIEIANSTESPALVQVYMYVGNESSTSRRLSVVGGVFAAACITQPECAIPVAATSFITYEFGRPILNATIPAIKTGAIYFVQALALTAPTDDPDITITYVDPQSLYVNKDDQQNQPGLAKLVLPANKQNAPVNTQIKYVFTQAINSVGSFVLTDESGNQVAGPQFTKTTNSVTFTPTNNLDSNKNYTATITNIQYTNGTTGEDVNTSFKTASQEDIAGELIVPEKPTEMPTDSEIMFLYNYNLVPSTVNTSNITLTNKTTGENVPITVELLDAYNYTLPVLGTNLVSSTSLVSLNYSSQIQSTGPKGYWYPGKYIKKYLRIRREVTTEHFNSQEEYDVSIENLQASLPDGTTERVPDVVQQPLITATATNKNHIIFVTTEYYAPNFGSNAMSAINAADTVCNNDPAKPPSGYFKAVLSNRDKTDKALAANAIYYNVKGEVIGETNNNGEFNGIDFFNPISSEQGDEVWTGTGIPNENCRNWTSNGSSDYGMVGVANQHSIHQAFNYSLRTCDEQALIYCAN